MENFRKEHDGMDATIADKRQIQPFYQEYKKIKSDLDTTSQHLESCVNQCMVHLKNNVSCCSIHIYVFAPSLVDLILF